MHPDVCFSCGSIATDLNGPTHEYMLSSPGCWKLFNDVLAREYSSLTYWKGHEFTVDAYACSHPGVSTDPRAVRSVYIHLASMYSFFKLGYSRNELSNVRMKFSQHFKNSEVLTWLEPPKEYGNVTIHDISNLENPDQHIELSRNWAEDVFSSWEQHHTIIKRLLNQSGITRL